MTWVARLVWLLLVTGAVVVHFAIPGVLGIGAFAPDLPLLLALVFAILARPIGGAVAGWYMGTLTGLLAGADLAAHSIAACLAGFALSWPGERGINVTAPVFAVLVALGTIVHGVLFVLLAPSSGLGGFLQDTILAAVYNGVLAFPIGAVAHKAFGRPMP